MKKVKKQTLKKFKEYEKERQLREQMFSVATYEKYQESKKMLEELIKEKEVLHDIIRDLKKQKSAWMLKFYDCKRAKSFVEWLKNKFSKK